MINTHNYLMLLLSLFFLISAQLPAPSVSANTTIVGTGQPQSCTEQELRNAVSAGGLIQFNCGGAVTIPLSSELTISLATEIDGGSNMQGGLVTLSGQNTTRIIQTSNQASLTIRNLTLRDGKGTGSDGRAGAIRAGWRAPVSVFNSVFLNNDGRAGNQEAGGGAIFVHEATLIIDQSHFEGNRGVNGGAINNLLSTLKISRSTFINNQATLYGGAIYTDGASWPTDDAQGGQIDIRSSRFEQNQATGQGGAAFLYAYPPDTILIDSSSFVNNLVSKDAGGTALGGGLRLGNADFTITNTSISANIARGQGGGLWRGDKGKGQLTNVTIANNQAISDPGTNKGGLGGGIAGGSWSCLNCTIANNTAGYQGGGIWGSDASIRLTNTIVANNQALNDGNTWDIKHNCGSYPSAYASDGGGNLEYPGPNPKDSSDLLCVAGAYVADPQLAGLASNGGSVDTMALAASSPALSRAVSPCPETDARGIPRPQGTGCDTGAYERVAQLSLQPRSVFAGSAEITLTVIGEGFSASSQIIWDGIPRTTQPIDSTTLTTLIPASELSKAREVPVQVSDSPLPAVRFQVISLQGRVFLPVTRR